MWYIKLSHSHGHGTDLWYTRAGIKFLPERDEKDGYYGWYADAKRNAEAIFAMMRYFINLLDQEVLELLGDDCYDQVEVWEANATTPKLIIAFDGMAETWD